MALDVARETSHPDLVAALLLAQAERRSGVFDVHAEGARTQVFLSDGSVVFAEQGTLGDTLGRVLVREGKLTTEQYTAAIQRMVQGLVESEQMRFGEVAVELGFLMQEQVNEALATQVRHKVLRCLMYETPGDRVLHGVDPLHVPIGDVDLELRLEREGQREVLDATRRR